MKRLHFFFAIFIIAAALLLLASCFGNVQERRQWTVSFDTEGGTAVPEQTVDDGARIQKPEDPTKPGYTFSGWTCFGESWSFLNHVVTENLTLNANWIPNQYTISVEGKQVKTVSYGQSYSLSHPQKEGFTFEGYTLNGSPFPSAGEYNELGNISLEESWKINVYTATFIAFGKEVGKTTFTVNDKTLTGVPQVKHNGLDVAWNYTIELRNMTIISDTVYFGQYEQDTWKEGAEPIEWYILDTKDGNMLLLSKYGLDNVRYKDKYTAVTWETSDSRKWLNETFYDAAFSESEKQKIIYSAVTADRNPATNADPGNDTQDNVFLLSLMEVEKYVKDDSIKNCVVTDYAALHKAHRSAGTKYGWWLTRTPGNDQGHVVAVFDIGGYNHLNEVPCEFNVLRPAVWVKGVSSN